MWLCALVREGFAVGSASTMSVHPPTQGHLPQVREPFPPCSGLNILSQLSHSATSTRLTTSASSQVFPISASLFLAYDCSSWPQFITPFSPNLPCLCVWSILPPLSLVIYKAEVSWHYEVNRSVLHPHVCRLKGNSDALEHHTTQSCESEPPKLEISFSKGTHLEKRKCIFHFPLWFSSISELHSGVLPHSNAHCKQWREQPKKLKPEIFIGLPQHVL